MLSVIECLAHFPVSWVEQNCTCRGSGVNWAQDLRTRCCHRRAKVPVREIPPVLAGIRASKSQNLAFPCDWRAQWLCQIPDTFHRRKKCIYLPLRGQHTFSVSRLTLLHCNRAPRHGNSSLFWRHSLKLRAKKPTIWALGLRIHDSIR